MRKWHGFCHKSAGFLVCSLDIPYQTIYHRFTMKKIILLTAILGLFGFHQRSFAQQIEKGDSLGLPGDNLNLYAVLDLFQQCATFEDFEKKLNEQDSKINNLDLNNDGKTDYIKVIDNKTGESHAVVLQVPVSEKENQDVAVIEIDKKSDGNVSVQIVGNEELYGKDYIVEPKESDPASKNDVAADGKTKTKRSDTTKSADGKTTVINNYYTTNNYNTNNNNNDGYNDHVYVSVNYWPVVHYMYSPSYVVYVSPWYWYSYPAWWIPWTPWYWHDYYWHHHNYYYGNYYHYHRADHYRSPMAHNYYQPRRTVSPTVQQHRTAGMYKETYTHARTNTMDKPKTTNPAYRGDNGSKGGNYGGQKNNPTSGRPSNNSGYQKPLSKPYNSGNTGRPQNNVVKPNYNMSKPVQPHNSGGGMRGGGGGGAAHPHTSGGGKRR